MSVREPAVAETAVVGPDGADRGGLRRWAYVSLIGLFVLALVVIAYVTRAVLVPVVVAAVIATIFMPIVAWAEKRGVARVVSAVVLTLTLAMAVAVLVIVLAMPVSYWIGRASEFGELIRDRLGAIDRPLTALQQMLSALHDVTGGERGVVAVDTSRVNIVETVLGVVTPALGQFILFLGALVFYFVYHDSIKKTLVLFFRERATRLDVMHMIGDVERQMSRYFATVALINAGLGAGTVLVTWLAGLAHPLLWGLMAALLNFVPYLGSAVVTVTLLVVGLLTFPTLLPALFAPGLFLLLTSLEGQFVTPSILGKRLMMNPFLLFLGMGFWTWLWGPVGAFLAVPILLAGAVVTRHLMPDDTPDLPD